MKQKLNRWINCSLAVALFILISSTASFAGAAEVADLSAPFGQLAGAESSLKQLGMDIDKAIGAETKPDRAFAMQDMANMCKTSKMQIHSLNSLFAVVKLVKMENEFQSTEAALLKKKCGYATRDFSRRKAFVSDILAKAKDQQLKDLAYIFDAQLGIIIKQLKIINSKLNWLN